MSIKQFLKEKKELIKANRRLIALGCGVSAVMVAVPSITGVVTSQQAKNKKDKDKYYYTPGEIRFDENGKLIIPEIIDKDKPSNGYQYKLESNKSIDFINELFNQEKFKKDLKANLTKTFDTILKSDKYKMDFEFQVTDDIKLLIKNLITDKDLGLGESVHINDFMNTIVNECINNPNYDILTQYNPEQLCALSGVDINKEYNDVMVQISNEQTISLYGGAGSLPNRPNNPTFDQPNNVELNNLTIKEYDEKVLAQNEYYQYVFMWTYRIILPSLIVFNIVLTLINTLTFGSLVILIAQTILDITFSTIQILKSEKDYENTKELRKNIDNIISQSNNYENLSTIFNANSLAINLFMLLKQDWVESAINTLAKKILKIKNEIIYNTKLRLKISSKIVSVLSISFTIIMTILEDNLIKDGI